MSRKLQGILGEVKRAPLFSVYTFFVIFFVLNFLLSLLMESALFFSGHLPEASKQIAENNEVFIQTLALLIALWGVFTRTSSGISKRVLLRDFLGESRLTWPATQVWISESLKPLLGGFVIASLGLLLLLLSGFLTLEGNLSASSFLLVPTIALRAAMLLLWVGVLELTRLKLSRLLVRTGVFEVVGLMALVIFEGYLIYSVMKTSGGPVERAFMALVALWWASLLSTWTLLTRGSVMASWKRICGIASFVVSVTCIYGFPLSWGRVASLTSVYEGPHPWSGVVLESPGILGQWSFILIFTGCFALLLRRVLTQRDSASA